MVLAEDPCLQRKLYTILVNGEWFQSFNTLTLQCFAHLIIPAMESTAPFEFGGSSSLKGEVGSCKNKINFKVALKGLI